MPSLRACNTEAEPLVDTHEGMDLAISDANSCIASLVAHRCNTNRDLMLSLWAMRATESASNLKLSHARKITLVPIINPSFQTNRLAVMSKQHKELLRKRG